MKRDSAVVNLYDLKTFVQILKRTITDTVLYAQKPFVYAYKTLQSFLPNFSRQKIKYAQNLDDFIFGHLSHISKIFAHTAPEVLIVGGPLRLPSEVDDFNDKPQ